MIFLVLIFSSGFFLSQAYAEYAAGKIMVKFKPGVMALPSGVAAVSLNAATVRAASVRTLNSRYGVTRVRQMYKDTLADRPEWKHLEDNFVLKFPVDQDVARVAEDYAKNPNVVSAVPVSIVRAFRTPNDPRLGDQYGLTNIDAFRAWDRTTGESSVLIAVLDTGINYNHEDFQASGKIDLADAWDYVNNDPDPWDDYDHEGSYVHGTTVSGVIAAVTNNNTGIAGVNWGARILPIKVLNSTGGGEIPHILEGITRAINKGADVINMSFGQNSADAGLQESCLAAYQAGIVLVAAAGNANVSTKSYPAACATVIAVAAVDSKDVRSVWGGGQASNYGDWIDVSAPGTNILSISKGNDYSLSSGTSLACPFVAGLAGLVKSVFPTISNQAIMDKITSEADNIDDKQTAFYKGKLGSGRINAFQALAGVSAQITTPETGAYVKGSVTVSGTAAGWGFSNYILEALDSGGSFTATIKASSSSVETSVLGIWDTLGYDGEYTIKLRVFSSSSSSSEETQVTVYVDNTTPEAVISSPVQGASLEGKVAISGTANDTYFDRYTLEYGQGTSPSVFELIEQSYVAVNSGLLATWETTGLTGVYTLKLTAYDEVGNSSSESRQVTILAAAPTKEVDPQPGLPLTYALPNPFNRASTSEVTFNFILDGNFNTRIYLFDLSGALIWRKSYSAGENGAKSGANNPAWNAVDLFGASVVPGIYFYQVVTDKRALARGKIIILN